MLGGGLRRTRSILGTLAGGELTVALLARVRSLPIGDVVNVVAESTLAGTVLTAMVEFSSELQLLAQGLQLCLFGYVLYIAVPEVVPDRAGPWTDQPSTRVTFVAGCLGASIVQDGVLEVGSVVVITALIMLLLISLAEADPLGEDGSIYRLMMTAGGADEERMGNPPDHVDNSWIVKRINEVMFTVGAAGILALIMGTVGMLTWTVGLFFPLPEVTILGWALAATAFDRLGRRSPTPPELDIEGDLMELVELMFENIIRGGATVLMVTFGLFVGAIPFVYVLAALPTLSPSAVDSFWVRLGPTVALLTGFVLYGAHSLWYWWRTARRLPAHFRWLRDGEATVGVVSPVFATLPGAAAILPAVFGFLAGGLFLYANPDTTYYPPWLSAVIALALLPGLALILLSIHRTRNREATGTPQPPDTERRVLPAAFAIQGASMTVFRGVTSNYNTLKASGLSGVKLIDLVGGAEALLLLIGLPALYYLPDVAGNAFDAPSERKYKRQLGFFAVALVAIPGTLSLLGVAPALVGAVAVGTAIVVALSAYDAWRQLQRIDENTGD